MALLRCAIYPHYYWARAIRNVLREHRHPGKVTLIDAPCGEGIISYWIMRSFPDCGLELVDRDEQVLVNAKKIVPAGQIIRSDLRCLDNRRGDDIWLLINSLFLLPNPEEIVNRMHPRASLIVGIFPDLEHPNYRCFARNNPEFQNPHAMSPLETSEFFERCGYHLTQQISLTSIPYHCIRIPRLNGLLRRLFLPLEPFFSKTRGAYWLGVFERS